MKHSRLLLTILFVAAFALTAMADALGYTSKKPLLFGIDIDYAPMEFLDSDGEPHGYDIEFTERLMKRLDIPFIYRPNTWENISGDVLNGRVDLGMMVFSPYRQDITNYSRAVFRLYYQIVYRKEDAGKRFDGRNLKGKSIAYMSSRPITDTLTKAGANLFVIKDLSQAFRQLSGGKYDAVICFRYQAKYIIRTYGLTNLKSEDMTLTPREYCYVSHNKQLIEAINHELDKMEQQGIILDVYGEDFASLGSFVIPTWVWYLLTGLVVVFLVATVVMQLRYQRRLRKEVERAQRSEHLKTVFLGNVSHALRTPLNAVIGFSDLLREDDGTMSNDDRNKLLGLINKNGQQLLHFIEELLELSNIEGKDQLFVRSRVHLRDAMEDYAETVRPGLHDGVSLKVVGKGGTVVLDPNLLRYIVTHLLDNAIENTDEGQITLKYGSLKGGFYVEVRDTGCGLPEALRKNIFNLLSEEQTYVQDKVPGLGLSICKAIIERTGGKMGAESPDEGGTVVWFWAPNEVTY